jgi:hypothetical protein
VPDYVFSEGGGFNHPKVNGIPLIAFGVWEDSSGGTYFTPPYSWGGVQIGFANGANPLSLIESFTVERLDAPGTWEFSEADFPDGAAGGAPKERTPSMSKYCVAKFIPATSGTKTGFSVTQGFGTPVGTPQFAGVTVDGYWYDSSDGKDYIVLVGTHPTDYIQQWGVLTYVNEEFRCRTDPTFAGHGSWSLISTTGGLSTYRCSSNLSSYPLDVDFVPGEIAHVVTTALWLG